MHVLKRSNSYSILFSNKRFFNARIHARHEGTRYARIYLVHVVIRSPDRGHQKYIFCRPTNFDFEETRDLLPALASM